ncbi:10093_t:CDS:10, partial [Funneliformis geosporum]
LDLANLPEKYKEQDSTPTTNLSNNWDLTKASINSPISPSGSTMDVDTLNVGKIVEIVSSKKYFDDNDEQIDISQVPNNHLPTSPSLTSTSGSMDIDTLNVDLAPTTNIGEILSSENEDEERIDAKSRNYIDKPVEIVSSEDDENDDDVTPVEILSSKRKYDDNNDEQIDTTSSTLENVENEDDDDEQIDTTSKTNNRDLAQSEIGDAINHIITEFLVELGNKSFKKEIQHFNKEIELHLLEQSDLVDEQINLQSSLRKSKLRMNHIRKELLDVQRERDRVCKELANERRTFAKEEQDRKKLEQAHNFLTDLETLREAADAEDNMQDEEEILDGFKGLLVSVASRCSDISLSSSSNASVQKGFTKGKVSLEEASGSLGILCRFNMLLEVCEKIIRQ